MPACINLIGKVFNDLTVLEKTDIRQGTSVVWRCLCICGNETMACTSALNNGHKKSCGCRAIAHAKTVNYRHGGYNDPEYCVWEGIIQRCTNKNSSSYHLYGGRGIRVSDEWRKSYAAFISDMGRRPDITYSIDRIDNSEGYHKDNCRWATKREQMRNTRKNIIITHKGESMCVTDWADRLGVKRNTLIYRIRRGWTHSRTIETPIGKHVIKS